MCGRTAQTRTAVRAAADILGAPQPREEEGDAPEERNSGESSSEHDATNSISRRGDNYNLSPGMGAVVFYKNKDGKIVSESKIWGLITKHGTTKNPLPTGMGPHFSALMYNARSDTLFVKQTFGNLLSKQQSCLVAVDGWFEWKQEVKGKKQPFFVKAKNQQYTMLPGLWAQVPTGRPEEPFVTTFTILTTEAAPCLTWLHSRMPVCCFDTQLALSWLDAPTQKLHEALLDNHDSSDKKWEWHAVTDEMTSLKFRSEKAIAPWKRPSIKSFFTTKGDAGETSKPASTAFAKNNVVSFVSNKTADEAKSSKKRAANDVTASPASKKLKPTPKKGSIAAFFSPKKSRHENHS
jgi:putative SOS response-associated peptidase YedK